MIAADRLAAAMAASPGDAMELIDDIVRSP